MLGDVLGRDVQTIYYIQSDSAFKMARMRGYLELVKGFVTGRTPYLLPFHQVVGDLCRVQTLYRGLQDIALENIVGSVGRGKQFTRQFYPLTSTERQKERWRLCYTKSLTGAGYPPIEVCKVGREYFVVNGHHRVSVARYLGWKTIEAHVSELCLSESA